MVQARIGVGLAGSLMEIASQPDRIDSLYSILGEYCHQVRNRLNSVSLCMYLSRQDAASGPPDVWQELDRQYRGVEQLVSQVQDVCRPIRLSPLRAPLGDLLTDRAKVWQVWFATRDRLLEFWGPEDEVPGSFDPQILGHALDTLAEWRSKVGEPRSPARVGWGVEGSDQFLDWSELDEDESGTNGRVADQPASLALPLIARVISAHGGSVELDCDQGFHVRMNWPL